MPGPALWAPHLSLPFCDRRRGRTTRLNETLAVTCTLSSRTGTSDSVDDAIIMSTQQEQETRSTDARATAGMGSGGDADIKDPEFYVRLAAHGERQGLTPSAEGPQVYLAGHDRERGV